MSFTYYVTLGRGRGTENLLYAGRVDFLTYLSLSQNYMLFISELECLRWAAIRVRQLLGSCRSPATSESAAITWRHSEYLVTDTSTFTHCVYRLRLVLTFLSRVSTVELCTAPSYWHSNYVRPPVCTSLCLSVTRWYCAKTAEPISKQSAPIVAEDISFSHTKTTMEKWSHPTGTQNAEIRGFRPSRCISEMVQDRDTVTTEGW